MLIYSKKIIFLIILLILLCFFKVANASFENLFQKTISYKNNNYEYNFNFLHKNNSSNSKENFKNYATKFIETNYSEDKTKNFISYSIVIEAIYNSGILLENYDFDIKYIQDFRNLFDDVEFKKQCESSYLASGVFYAYGVNFYEKNYKRNFLDCEKYISQFELGYSINQFLGSRSFLIAEFDEDYKLLAERLTNIKPYEHFENRLIPVETIEELNWETLLKFKGYIYLSTYFEEKKNYDEFIINIEKAKKYIDVSKNNWITNAVLEGQIEYSIMNFKKSRSSTIEEKILLFENFDKTISRIFSKDLNQKYISTIYYLDAYISYISNQFDLDKDESKLRKNLDFAVTKAMNSFDTEYLLSFIDMQKKNLLNDYSQTKGIINSNNPLLEGSNPYQNFVDKVEDAYDEKKYQIVIDMVDQYESENGILSMTKNPYLTFLKYASLDFSKKHKEAIEYNFELIRNFAEETFFSSEVNYLDSSQSLKNKEKINELSVQMIKSLFYFQYGEGYDGDKDGDERYSMDYRTFLPDALNMILFAGQISDLNDANHSNKYLSLKNTINLGLKSANQNLELSNETKDILKNLYNNEKKFIRHSNLFPNDLDTLFNLRKNIDLTQQNLNNSKELQLIKQKFPNIHLGTKPPLQLTQILGKLNLDEKLIYLKDFGKTIFVFSISHNEFDWLHVYEDELEDLKIDISNYKKIISSPRTVFDKELSNNIFNSLFWTSINVNDMESTNKIYFINSSNLIDLPLETLVFVNADDTYPETYLVDYFNFVYLPSIHFFQEITSEKLIAGQMGYSIRAKFVDDNFIGFEIEWVEGYEQGLMLFNTFKINDVITEINGEEMQYGHLVAFLNSPSNCKRGFKKWCNFNVSFIRGNKKLTKEISIKDHFTRIYDNNYVGFGDPLFAENQSNTNIDLALNKLRFTENFEVDNLDEFFELLPPLPETEFEISHPAELLEYNKTKTFLGKKASEYNFKSLENQATRILAIASHAVSIGDNDLIDEPSLIFSNIKEDKEDGILTASEIFDLNISNDLVILSACNTFSSSSDSIHKISGLANSFILAGSNNLILSRWPVDSEATMYLMTKFYRSIIFSNEDGFSNDYSASLRWAMLETKKVEKHPFYWAPFLLIGQ